MEQQGNDVSVLIPLYNEEVGIKLLLDTYDPIIQNFVLNLG